MSNANLAFQSNDVGPNPQRSLKMLILDDDEFDRKQVQRLSSQMAFPTEIDEASDLVALQDRLDSAVYDAILIDYRLSSGDGLDALDIIAANKANRSAARIMLAGEPTYKLAVQAMKHGCDEFLGKDNLDSASMQKGVLGAILSSTKKVSASLNVEIQELANSIANGVSETCLTNMRPMVLGMLHRTSVLKENKLVLSDQSLSAISVIEQSCLLLKDFLSNIEAKATQGTDSTGSKVVPLVK